MNITKIFMLATLVAMISSMTAQTAQKDYKLPPKPTEKVFRSYDAWKCDAGGYWRRFKKSSEVSRYKMDKRHYYSEEELYQKYIDRLKERFPKSSYPGLAVRNFKSEYFVENYNHNLYTETYYYISATLVLPDSAEIYKENLSKTVGAIKSNFPTLLEKAMQNVPIGSRVAIDQIKLLSGLDEDDFKDRVIELFIEKGYKVVAKEFLQRLYEEQKQQHTGVYNEETMAQENNFSAVGYYITIKTTDNSVKMQVVNVSTGEYEGNATINF